MRIRLIVFFVLGAVVLGGIFFIQRKQHVEQGNKINPSPESQQPPHEPDSGREARYNEQHNAVAETSDDKSAGTGVHAGPSPVTDNPDPRPARQTQATAEHEAFFAKFNSKLTDDPATEEFLRNRLWLALDKLNSPLVSSLGLTPTEMEKFKDLVVDNLVTAADRAVEILDQGPAAVEAEVKKDLTAQQEDYDKKVEQILGAARFAAYKTYKDDYSQYNRIKFLNSGEPLTDSQTEQVLVIMADERELVNSAAEKLRTQDGADSQSAPINEQTRVQLQKLIDERVYARLKDVLSPDRLAAFAEFRAQQTQESQSTGTTKSE